MIEEIFEEEKVIIHYKIEYARKVWNIALLSEGLELNGVSRRLFIFNKEKVVDYGMTRNFLKAYTKFKYGISIPSNQKLPSYDLIIALADDYDMCRLIYKYKEVLKKS